MNLNKFRSPIWHPRQLLFKGSDGDANTIVARLRLFT
jgi:hypothetical protein